MKAGHRDYLKVAKRSGAAFRLHFFCGPDEAGASSAVAKLVELLPEAGERIDLSGADLRSDPTRLVDEARSTSLFGDSRHIVARVSGEDAQAAVASWCELADRGEMAQGWPIFIVATSATDKARTAAPLLKRADALVAMFYPPDMTDLVADVRARGYRLGLRVDVSLAETIAHAAGMDVRLALSEVEKLALYCDASPQAPKQADRAAWEAIGASTEDDDFMPLVNASLGAELNRLPAELVRLREVAMNPVAVALAMERRAAQLAILAPKLRQGQDIKALLSSHGVFFKEHRFVIEQLKLWSYARLEKLIPRLADLHRLLLANSQTAELLLARELTNIARYAAARR
ncbi:MAG: DNA polymerase III subunit delta [Erythrobacter sp.]|nr:MAG: DNA polymerase III subunit delta [Erythrobacter sp.]